MADPLTQYVPPANINDFPKDRAKRDQLRAAWDRVVDGLISISTSANFYDPKVTATGDAEPVKVEWTAFPKQTEDDRTLADPFQHADVRPPDAQRQYEYCEWCVERDPGTGKIRRVTFTTEDVDYWRTLWSVDPQRVLGLYRQHVNPNVQLEDLHAPGDPGTYVPRNKWNTGNEYLPDRGGSMHMIVGINTIEDAVGLVSTRAALPNDLPSRHSHRADAVVILSVSRVVVRLGLRLSFSNPVGIYLQEPSFNRFELPAGAPRDLEAKDLWRVVRGRRSEEQGLRAVFEVPSELGFTVSDVLIDGEPIRTGSQIARTVRSGTYVTPIPRAE